MARPLVPPMTGGCNLAGSMTAGRLCSKGDSSMRSSGLSATLLALAKLGAAGTGGGGRLGCRGRGTGGEALLVGSEAECKCRVATPVLLGLRERGFECGEELPETGGEGVALWSPRCGVGEREPEKRLELLCFSFEEPEERLERLFPLSDSVSLVHEKARVTLVWGWSVLLPAGPGGVTSPTGMRSSTSLSERFNLTMAASPSMAEVSEEGVEVVR